MRLRFRYVLVALAALLAGFLLGIPRVHAQAADATSNRGAVESDTLYGTASSGQLRVR